MIISLTGTVRHCAKGYVFLSVGDVGYRVFFPENKVQECSGEITVYTHEVIRENEREFYGFFTLEALELFWKFLHVSGVGPRSAQKIVFSEEISVIKEKISKGDLSFFTSISGIGKKTAQKILLELKGTIEEEPGSSSYDSDAIEALVGLGYRRREAEEILLRVQAESTDEKIREALRLLSK